RGRSEGDPGRHGLALGRKAERRWPGFAVVVARRAKRRIVGAANPATAIDEGIEHHVEELVGELEAHLLCAGRRFTGQLVQGGGEIIARKVEERHEDWRQRGGVVEEVVDRVADIELVDGEERGRRIGLLSRQRKRQPRYRLPPGSPGLGSSPDSGTSCALMLSNTALPV